MANANQKIKMLSMFRLNPDKFLPIIDHAWKVFPKEDRGTEWYDDKEVNLGWDTGLLGADRPYFLECWASNGITMLTYFVSVIGIENASTEDLVKMLTDAHLFRLLDPEHPRTSVMKFEDDNGNVFFSINVPVAFEDEMYIEGGTIYPFGPLNEYNSRKSRKADKISMIYLDMDGVLADFERGVKELCHMEALSQNGKRDLKQDDLMWAAIRETDHFYDRLELMPGAKEMFDRIYKKYGDQCEILTGIPWKERGIVTAEQDKRNWTRRMLSDTVKVNAVCRKHKQNYCTGLDSVLIDDREKTIREWRELGGTGILFENAEETIKKLEELGLL